MPVYAQMSCMGGHFCYAGESEFLQKYEMTMVKTAKKY